MKRRLFVAAALDDPARTACARVAERLRASGWTGRWIDPRSYHLTLAFLGGVEDERVAAVTSAVEEAASRLHSVTVPLDAVGAFPQPGRPRVAWVGPRSVVPAFGTLCGVVRSELVVLGFAFEAEAQPHVTLARGDGRIPLPTVQAPRTSQRIDALTLYESFTETTGARHEALARVPLRAREQPSD